MSMRSWIGKLITRPATRTIRNVPRRTRLNLEQLEDRLTPSALGVTFDDGTSQLSELPVLSYSWGASNPSGRAGTASLQNFSLTLAPTSAEPGLWGHLAVGSHLNSATIHVRNAAGAEYLTYGLTNVNIASFSTSSSSGDTIQLAYDAVTETYLRFNERGDPVNPPSITQYNRVTGTSTSIGWLPEPSAPPVPLGVTFTDNGVTTPELEISSYSWAASKPSAGAGTASFQNFTLTLEPRSDEPGLWGRLAIGSHVDSATIHVRKTGTEYLTYTLTNATIASFATTHSDSSGTHPRATIQLAYDTVSESYRPINPDRTLGTANSAQYNRVTGATSNSGTLTAPSAGTPPMGLTFVEAGVTRPELAVASYSWGASNPSGGSKGAASLQNFSLTLDATSAEPGLWGHLAVGSHLNSATIYVRNPAGTAYLTYILQDVTIVSFSTGAQWNEAVPQATIQLAYAAVSESYRPINPDGTLGTANSAQYNRVTGASSTTGTLTAPSVITPTLGLTFVEGGVTTPELAVRSYSWGASNPSGRAASLQNFSLTLTPTSAEPGLWGRLAVGSHLNSATIHVRKTVMEGLTERLTEYLTYTLTNVTIASFSTSSSGGDTIQLAYDAVSETYIRFNERGDPLPPTITQYNRVTGTSSGIGGLAEPSTSLVPVGLTFVEDGVTTPVLDINSYSWGASNPSAGAGTASLQNFTLTLPPNSNQPGLWGRLAVGRLLDSATIHLRHREGSELTYTLTNVIIASFATTNSDNTGYPQATIQLAYDTVSESYRPINPDHTLGTVNSAKYNRVTGANSSAGSLTAPSAGRPPLGLTFEDGFTSPELAVVSYSWGANNPSAGVGTAGFQNFSLTLDATSAEPGLWGHLAVGRHLNSATIHVRNPADTEYLTYRLQDVTIVSFSTGGDWPRFAPLTTIQLAYDSLSELYRPFNPDGTLGMTANSAQYNQVTGVSSATGSLGLTYGKQSQTINFGPLADKLYDAPDFAISATATSGLPVSFTASEASVYQDSSGVWYVHIIGARPTITAHQAGDSNYSAAPDVAQRFGIAMPDQGPGPDITRATQTISGGSLPNSTYGDPDFVISATATSGLPVSFTASGSARVYQDAGGTWYVHIIGAGSATIIAHQVGNASYYAAPDAPRVLTIARTTADIVVSGYTGGTYDGSTHTQTITVTGVGSDGVLFTTDLTGTNAGSYTKAWSYSNANYNDVSGTMAFDIAKAIASTPTISNLTVTQWTRSKSGFTGTMTIANGTPAYAIVGKPTGVPPGLTAVLSGNTIRFTGMPSKAGTFKGSITIKGSGGAQVTKTFTIKINPALTFTPAKLAAYQPVGFYSQTITTAGGTGSRTVSYTLSGPLPAGLTISRSPKTGAITISGTTRAMTSITLTVTVTDSIGAQATITYKLVPQVKVGWVIWRQ